MTKTKRLVRHALLLALIFALSITLSTDQSADIERHGQTDEHTDMAANQTDRTGDMIVNAVPDGGSVSYDEFRKKVGDEVADLLSWANPKRITRDGNHFILESDGGSTRRGSATINIKKKVEFDLDRSSSELSARNIKGVSVDIPGYIFSLDLKEADIAHDVNGNTRIQTRLLVSRFLPYVKYDVTLGPDGQPLK